MTATASPRSRTGELHRIWSSQVGIPGFFSAVSHKQIALRFIWTGLAFLALGGVEALLLRIQLAGANNDFLGPEAYNQVFTMHGTTMMFLFAVPVLEGLAMYLVPLQVGTRDLPLPRLNALGYWIYLAGGILLNWSLLTGSIPDGGWFAYVPLTGPEFSPTRALDFWLLGVTFVEISGIIGAIELVVVILRFRAPGMSLGRIPLFVWSVLVMAVMMLIAFPFVVAATLLLELERKVGAPFYDPAGGGNPLLWQHLFWIFGHPEVYIMLLPATGIVSAVVAVHSRRRIVAYPYVVAALIGIGIVSFGLWVHHMFAVGLPVMVLSLFAVASYSIAIPSGIQIFAWIGTIWSGRPRWTAAMWFVAGFIAIFVIGGVTGVMVATAPWNLQAHDTFFVVAHFHYVLIGGVVFPMFAGLMHWFPKLSGRRASEFVGKAACVVMFVGFNITFMPQHWLGLQGMARRVYSYDDDLGWDGWNLVSTWGAFVLAAGFAIFLGNLLWAWRRGPRAGDDPWNGDTLEWSTPSPPPFHNFDVVPTVAGLSPGWEPEPSELDADVADAIAVTGRPWGDRREVIRTSVVDARPEQIVTLPGPSYFPAITATSFTVAVIGVLVDWFVLAIAGGIATALVVSLWALDNLERQRPSVAAGGVGADAAESDAAEQRRREDASSVFARSTEPGRGAVWWACSLAVVAVGTVIAAMIYAYVYLRLGAERWPIEGDPDSIAWPLAALVAMIGALVIGRTVRRGRMAGAVAGVLAATGATLQLVALGRGGLDIDANAYDAIVVTLGVASVIPVAVALMVRAVAVVRADRRFDSLLDADAVLFTSGIAIWLVVWVVIEGGGRLL